MGGIFVSDVFRLERYVEAQNRGGSYSRALAEMRRGRKNSHWIWYVFPQIAGLGKSATSQYFAISTLEEAEFYLQHPVLGPRLIEITATVNSHADLSATDIFASDDVKFRSSMTLFMRANPDEPLFREALFLFFNDEPDSKTDAILGDA